MSGRRVRGLVHGTALVVLATAGCLTIAYVVDGVGAVHTAWSTFLSGFWIYYLAWAAAVIAFVVWQNGESA